MAETVDFVLKWTLAIVYAVVGSLIGAAFTYMTLKVFVMIVGETVLSVETVQAIVIMAAVASALFAAFGFVRQR